MSAEVFWMEYEVFWSLMSQIGQNCEAASLIAKQMQSVQFLRSLGEFLDCLNIIIFILKAMQDRTLTLIQLRDQFKSALDKILSRSGPISIKIRRIIDSGFFGGIPMVDHMTEPECDDLLGSLAKCLNEWLDADSSESELFGILECLDLKRIKNEITKPCFSYGSREIETFCSRFKLDAQLCKQAMGIAIAHFLFIESDWPMCLQNMLHTINTFVASTSQCDKTFSSLVKNLENLTMTNKSALMCIELNGDKHIEGLSQSKS